MDVKVLGCIIGKSDDWTLTDNAEVYINFTPNENFVWKYNDLTFDWTEGLFVAYTDEGADIIHTESVFKQLKENF